MDRLKASKARQQLRQTEGARAAHLERVLKANAMVEGSFVELGRKCGKPSCKCATGEKHYSKYLSRSVEGRTKLVYVPGRDEVELNRKAERYRRFRQARAELMKLAAHTAELADELQAALTEPYPPDNPLPPATRRGRPPKARKK